ncbi:MAG: hypothetical protein IJK51_03270 [Bacteroidaceae bacterium]|nr:hypothetical protein [Bacteroidaceae bacterium]
MGTPELPGIRKRIYYISKDQIAEWPTYIRDVNNRRMKKAAYRGDFVLVADAKWKYIDILPEKSQLTSEPQGELPSQTQLNKLVAVFPGVSPEASAAACYLNNSDNVFLVEDMKGFFRVVGCRKWFTKTTVSQDNGQGPTGTTSTTINVEAPDEVPSPFYMGIIETELGDVQGEMFDDSDDPAEAPVYDNEVSINGLAYNVAGREISIHGPLTTIIFTGENMQQIKVRTDNSTEDIALMDTDRTTATWRGNLPAPATVAVSKRENNTDVLWFILEVTGITN